MNLQVLVATMNQNDHSLLNKMNIQSDAIIGNQSNRNEVEEFKYNGHKIKYLSFAERGVGLNRNNTLMRADADICLFADDDVVYCDNYKELVLSAFAQNPDADLIAFNVKSSNQDRVGFVESKKQRIRFYNFMRHGTYRLAIRLKTIRKENIYFSLLFGGGAKYSCGEDTLFLLECLRSRLVMYSVPICIGEVKQIESTWFDGYTDKYFKDKGVLFAAISRKLAWLLSIQFVIRKYKLFRGDIKPGRALKLMFDGIRQY